MEAVHGSTLLVFGVIAMKSRVLLAPRASWPRPLTSSYPPHLARSTSQESKSLVDTAAPAVAARLRCKYAR